MTDDQVEPTTGAAEGTNALRARLRVEPHPAAGCAVLAAGDRGEDVVQTEGVTPGGGEDCECHATVTVTDGEDRTREYVEGALGDFCVCPAFQEIECAAEIVGFRQGALVVSVTVPRRELLRDLVDVLREREATVHLEQVLPLQAEDEGRQLTVDAARITDKQRTALATAVELGYYERPRRADLADVATALGISRSATSQRLNAAESTLVGALVEAGDFDHGIVADVPDAQRAGSVDETLAD